MSKFTKISFILLITITSALSFQVTATQLVIANKDTNRPYLPISGSDRAHSLATNTPRNSDRRRVKNRNDERGFQVLALEGDRERISVGPTNVLNEDDSRVGNRYVIGALQHVKQSQPAQFGIEAKGHHRIEPESVVHETNKLILLTDGEHIKLFPLVQTDLSPLALPGGHYVIKSAGFNLTDPSTLEALGPNSTYTKWLQHKQQLIESFRLNKTTTTTSLGGEQANDESISILPQKKSQRTRLLTLLGAKNSTATSIEPSAIEELLSDGELYPKTGDWQKPLIASVGYFFDQRFCLPARQSEGQDQDVGRGGATDARWMQNHLRNKNNERCLVVYWLDSRNKFVHLGSLQFNGSTRIELLQTKFDPNGTLKSSGHLFNDNQTGGDRRPIKLRELPPIDLCAKAGVERHSCRVFSVSIDKRSLKMYALFALHDDDNNQIENRIFSAQLELATNVVNDRQYVATLSQTSLVISDVVFKSAGLSGKSSGANNANLLKNSISSTSPFRQTNLLYLDNSTPGQSAKIHSLNLGPLPGADQPSLLNKDDLNSLRQTTLLDAQWETAKMKVKRQNSNKLNETFSVIGWALDQASCGMCWLTSDNELYSSQMGQNDHNLETKFAGKLVPTRPLIRMPITAMQLFHNTLFFVDSTRRSLMAYKLPALQSHDSNEFNSHKEFHMHGGSMKDDRVPKLESTHHVLLVEISPIQDFSLIDLSDKRLSRSRRSQYGYSNSCYGLSELLRKKQETSRNLFDRSRDNEVPTFRTGTATTDADIIISGVDDNYSGIAGDAGQIYELHESRRLRSFHPSSAQENYISYEKIDSDTNYRDLGYVAFLVCCLAAIALLICFNYFFWVRESNMLAHFLTTTNSPK